jgi:hydrogenase/urease accessory protein HupE
VTRVWTGVSRLASPVRVLVLSLAVLCPGGASAHAPRLSQGDWSFESGSAEARLTFHRGELRALAPDGLEETAARDAVLGRLATSVQVLAGGQPCALEERALRPVEEDGWRAQLRWRCASAEHRWTVQLPLLADLSAGHTHLARVSAGGETVERIARATTPSFEIASHPSVLHEAGRFFRLGVEHIFTGWDHLAFLLALLLLGGRLRNLAAIVSSFTLAHSVTLALAALGIVVPPSRLVEPAIAASVVAVAGENLWALRPGGDRAGRIRDAVAHRWRLTFVFGLVHGFGFAGALRELELPRAALAAGLVSFNLGVECGQLLIVAAAVPLLAGLARIRGFRAAGVPALSLTIALLGLVWLGERLGGGG